METYYLMRILVTGASGFIGSHLSRALLAAGHQVRALLRPTSDTSLIDDLELEIHIGDLDDAESLIAASRRIEVIYHCGAYVGGWRDRERMINSHIQGTENVLHAAKSCGVRRVIYTSSVAALGIPEHPTPGSAETIPFMDETHRWNLDKATWPYGYAKDQAEARVRHAAEEGLEGIILNPSAVFGPGDKNMVSSAIVYYMARGWIPPVPPGGINVVHIDDVVRGHLAALEVGTSGERYILGGENLTLKEILHTIASVVGRKPPRWAISAARLESFAGLADFLHRTFGFPIRGHILRLVGHYFYYDLQKSARVFNTPPPISFHHAVEAAFHWYQTAGFL
jgi:dihydroflavonol-4-reductase